MIFKKANPVFISLPLILVLLTGCSEQPEPEIQEPANHYNVLVIIADAMRQDSPGCYGGEALTPNLDRLAERGVLFENARATSPWTGPSCVSMLTGNYATSYTHRRWNKTRKIDIPENEELFGEMLVEFDYEPVALLENVQTWHHEWYQSYNVLRTADAFSDHEINVNYDSLREVTGGELLEESLGFKNTALLLDHLLKMPDDQRFFVVFWMLDPHAPFEPEEKFLNRIDTSRFTLHRPLRKYLSTYAVHGRVTDSEKEYIRCRYLAEVESVDERVGYILKALEHKNLLESTYIVFTSDHGEQFGEHDYHGHGKFFYENILRVPLIIAGPELAAGHRSQAEVTLIGLMPTLQDLLGIDYGLNMQGDSFEPALHGEPYMTDCLYFDNIKIFKQVDALIVDNFKLISQVTDDYLLFDLENDPDELENLATSGDNERLRAMKTKLKALREINKERQELNGQLYSLDERKDLSRAQKEKLIKQLKTLGYIQ